MKRSLLLAIVLGAFLTACASNQSTSAKRKYYQDMTAGEKSEYLGGMGYTPAEAVFITVGEGVPPVDTVSPAQAKALAKRAAIADAQRQLASKLYGVKINAKDTVKDAMLRSSVIDARVSGLIKNAAITKQDFKDGLYRVEMEVRMGVDTWRDLFSY